MGTLHCPQRRHKKIVEKRQRQGSEECTGRNEGVKGQKDTLDEKGTEAQVKPEIKSMKRCE